MEFVLGFDNKVSYIFYFDGKYVVDMNKFIGKILCFMFDGSINCVYCGSEILKLYSQGYCFICQIFLVFCDQCCVQFEKCYYVVGIC